MQNQVLEKLDWPDLVKYLSSFCQTQLAKSRCLEISPNLDQDTIERRWLDVLPLRDLYKDGYTPPIGDIQPLEKIIHATKVGQLLEGTDFRAVLTSLISTEQVKRFAKDFHESCPTLRRFANQLYPFPALKEKIEKTVDPSGVLRDDASKELKVLREAKLNLRKKIEDKITKLFIDQDLELYLQDKFFTIRAERYVIPIKLDGRGRVKGSIYDTSQSGQTLFIEPEAIAAQNAQLLELDLLEKLEILRIFRELSADVAKEIELIETNYHLLIELDFLCAQGNLAANLDAQSVKLSQLPTLSLINARHPLLQKAKKQGNIANTIELNKQQNSLIISGPNAGGKTVVLKTVGIIQAMAKSGLLLPVDAQSELYLFKNIFLELGDAQNLIANLSTFSAHLLSLKPILDHASPEDLVLLDELAMGTDPQTGAALAQAVLEELMTRNCVTITTTHYNNLKTLAFSDKRYRNGSMEFSSENLKPTYRLTLDIPGQSYGIELAEQIGINSDVVKRAKQLRGQSVSSLEQAVQELTTLKQIVQKDQTELQQMRLETERLKAHWQVQIETLEKSRQQIAQDIAEKHQTELQSLRNELENSVKAMQKLHKSYEKSHDSNILDKFDHIKQQGREALKSLQTHIHTLSGDGQTQNNIAQPPDFDHIQLNQKVVVLPFNQKGEIVKMAAHKNADFEVNIGKITVRAKLNDLRLLTESSSNSKELIKHTSLPKPKRSKPISNTVEFTQQTPTNTVDVRGLDVDKALEAMWKFIDQAVLRGERSIVIIHGHGSEKLKRAIRTALEHNCPYDIKFRAGETAEGADDGVTVVGLQT